MARQGQTNVGGQPLFKSGVGTSAASAADVAIDLGWKPDYIIFYSAMVTLPVAKAEWVRGMASDTALITTSSTGAVTLDAADAIVVSDTGFTIASELQVNDAVYSWLAFRYSA